MNKRRVEHITKMANNGISKYEVKNEQTKDLSIN